MHKILGAWVLAWVVGGGSVGCGGKVVSEPEVASGPAELGHLTVPAMQRGDRWSARMFHAYRPADDRDARRPLFVVMNGARSSAIDGIDGDAPTSMGMLARGVGPWRLEPSGGGAVPNPASWTRFGQVLFLDARSAGFSYGLRPSTEERASCGLVDDAADHLLALLEFLQAHPALRTTRVVLVGEGTAAARAVAMLKLLRNPELAPTPELRAAIAAQGDAAARLTQFAEAVLLQPVVLGEAQLRRQASMLADDPLLGALDPGTSPRDVRRSRAQQQVLEEQALAALADPIARGALLGARLEDAPTMSPAARTEAFSPALSSEPTSAAALSSAPAVDRALALQLGPLATEDRYFAPTGASCVPAGATEPWFLDLLYSTRFFVTDAKYDASVHTPALFAALGDEFGLPVEEASRDVVVHLPQRTTVPIVPALDARLRVARYEAGHAIERDAAGPLADDVERWIAER